MRKSETQRQKVSRHVTFYKCSSKTAQPIRRPFHLFFQLFTHIPTRDIVLPELKHEKTRPRCVELFSCSTQLSIKLITLINVKMPTIVGILAFISMINTTSEILKSRNFFICRYFSIYKQLKFRTQLS